MSLSSLIRGLVAISACLLVVQTATGQTNSISSGNWSDPTVWSTGVVPPITATVNAGDQLTIDQNITVGSGTFRFGYDGTANTGASITDNPGGTAYSLTATTGGGTLDIRSGTTTFEGTANFDNSTIIVRAGATLIIGATTIGNNTQITVAGTLIINGDLTNNNNGTGNMSITGFVQVNGNYNAPVGSVSLSGSGDFYTTGTISTTGSSDIFGSKNDCGAGPCSGRNLCGYTNSISADQVICSGVTPATLTSVTNAAGPVTYQWQVNSTSSSTFSTVGGASDIAGATASTYSPAAIVTATVARRWYRLYINDASTGCASYSIPVEIDWLGSGGWLGNTNDWNTASNWCSNSVPTSATQVIIEPFPAASGKVMPVIGTANANCGNLTINKTTSGLNGSVTITGAFTFNISGKVTNNGIFTDNASSNVVLKGSVSQTITGLNTLNNLTIANTAAAQPSIVLSGNNMNVTGTLTMTQGNFNLSGYNLILGTSAASTGTLSRTGGWFYGGNLTRWMPSTAVAVGAGVTGPDLFPIGSSSDFRPFQLGFTALAAGGSVKISHTSATGATAVNFTDNPSGNVKLISNSFWTVTTTGFGGVGGTPFTVQTSGTGFGTVVAVSDLRLVTAAAAITGSTPGVNAGTLTNPIVIRTSVSAANILSSSFYWGSTNPSGTTLPVTLTDFSGRAVSGGAELTWVTESEENFDYFLLEGSKDGEVFHPVTQQQGKGTTTVRSEYSYFDSNASGRTYYRLRIVNMDRSFSFSKVISVDAEEQAGNVTVYPNPVANRAFTVQFNEPDATMAQVVLIDQLGKAVDRIEFQDAAHDVLIRESVPAGVYFLKVSRGSMTKTIKVIIL